MRAIVMRRTGGPEVLALEEDFPRPEPAAGQVLVEIRARVGVDWIGRRVAWFAPQPGATGTYAEFAAVPAAALLPIPDTIDDLTAAAIPLQGITAHVLVHRAARIHDGQTVLVHAAAGGIGLLAVQMARRLGARVLGTVSSEAKAPAVREAGGEPFVRGDDLVERVKAATDGRGVDLVLDSIGRPTQAASLAMLAPFGELVHFGDAGGLPGPVDPNDLYSRSLKSAPSVSTSTPIPRPPTARGAIWSPGRPTAR